MKKQILLFMAIVCSLSILAQDKVSEYTLSYFDGETFEIQATVPKNGKFTYYIYCKSKEPSHSQVGFYFESKDFDSFITELRSIEDKFEEWSNTAKANNVTDYDKKFDTNFKRVGTFFLYGSKWCFSGTKFAPYFKVTKDGECLAVINVGKMTASSNQFMHHDGFMIAFVNKQEIEDFIAALNPENILNKEVEQTEKDNLFKD